MVTGAGRGIGRDIAIRLANMGANTVLCSRTQSDLDEVFHTIRNAGGEALSVRKDLTKAAQVEELMKTASEYYGSIDILINNAGGYPPEMYADGSQPTKIWEWSEEQWDKIIETNLKTTFLCTNKALPYMLRQRHGYIVNMSSRMGRIASEMGAYAAAKSAVIALTKTTAIQAYPYGILVNAVSPGMVDTPGQRVYNDAVHQKPGSMGDTNAVVEAVV
ncbi:MAG TPA: SDR family NAD(P)-dependent oxidoreductase, partial [Clostridia bacterium]|nr:SDR family NAD(P)-dependent oxidoreductase [Clostridia bacterium]